MVNFFTIDILPHYRHKDIGRGNIKHVKLVGNCILAKMRTPIGHDTIS